MLVLFDVMIMMKLYFMHIILYLVFTIFRFFVLFCFWLKANEVIFWGCIGLTDTVVLQ